jgi:DNA-binding NarL/FixJ family response regulator
MKVLLVDDHPIILEILDAVVRSVFPECTLRVAKNLDEVIGRPRQDEAPDLVLLDLGLPGYAGLDALLAVRRAYPEARVLIVSATEDRASILSALQAGAVGYVPKTHPSPLIAAALRLVAEGGTYVPPQALCEEKKQCVTHRQLDVLRLLVKGFSNKQIGQRLRIAEETVKQHAKAVYAALGIGNRNDAGRAAQRRGIKLD